MSMKICLRTQFINFFHNVLCIDPLFTTMEKTVEASPWHREMNVLVHTRMVVDQYLCLVQREWGVDELCGALACAFHDVGKPAAETLKHSEARGDYRSYPGHELISARLWVDWSMRNWGALEVAFGEGLPTGFFENEHRYAVTWLIEKHLPYELKDKYKRDCLLTTISRFGNTFFDVLRADGNGRIADDAEEKHARVEEWICTAQADIATLTANYVEPVITMDTPLMYVLIGASGSGKSTFAAMHDPIATVFSLDELRLKKYGNPEGVVFANEADRYAYAWQQAADDNTFKSECQNVFSALVKTGKTIIVDTAEQKRRNYLDNAKRHGYTTVGVVFYTSLQTVKDRQTYRKDKYVEPNKVEKQYMNMPSPSYGEFDEIVLISS